MTKYEPLRNYLLSKGFDRIPMTFAEIERVLGSKLPSSSETHRAWWSNNPSNNVMTKEWLAAGYETEQVDLGGRKLVFRKVGSGSRNALSPALHSPDDGTREEPSRAMSGRERLEALLSEMRGLLRMAPDFDPTKPVEADWPEPYVGQENTR